MRPTQQPVTYVYEMLIGFVNRWACQRRDGRILMRHILVFVFGQTGSLDENMVSIPKAAAMRIIAQSIPWRFNMQIMMNLFDG